MNSEREYLLRRCRHQPHAPVHNTSPSVQAADPFVIPFVTPLVVLFDTHGRTWAWQAAQGAKLVLQLCNLILCWWLEAKAPLVLWQDLNVLVVDGHLVFTSLCGAVW